jgi:hypothetical protein
MRLIDSERLKKSLEWLIDPIVYHDVMQTIEEQEEVEAIPIAWLTKRYCAAGVFASPSYHKRADIVRQIIRDYKREQEQIGETEC